MWIKPGAEKLQLHCYERAALKHIEMCCHLKLLQGYFKKCDKIIMKHEQEFW